MACVHILPSPNNFCTHKFRQKISIQVITLIALLRFTLMEANCEAPNETIYLFDAHLIRLRL